MFLKKLISVLLAALLVFSLSACKKEPEASKEYGKILDADILVSKESEEPTPETLKDHDEEIKRIDFLYPGLSFYIPKNWNAEFKNARCVFLNSSLDNLSFSLICIPQKGGEESIIPSNAEGFFKDDLEGIEFEVDSRLLHEKYNESPSKIVSFKDNGLEYSLLYYEDVYILDDKDVPADNIYNSIHADFFYESFALSLRTIFTEDKQTDAENCIQKIMSSFCPAGEDQSSLCDITLNDIVFRLPSEFVLSGADENPYILAGTKDSSKYSGMAICVDPFNLEEKESLSIAKEIVPAISRHFLASGRYNVIGSIPDGPLDIVLLNKPAAFYTENISYVANSYNPASFYGKEGCGIMFLYYVPSLEKTISLFFLPNQIESAIEIDSLIQTSLKEKR